LNLNDIAFAAGGWAAAHAGTVLTAASDATSAPAITGFAPTSGPVGSTVTLTGSGFSGVTAVAFSNGSYVSSGWQDAVFTVVSDKTITATVPSGAVNGQLIVEATAGDLARSAASFTVVPTVTLTAFTPASGLVGGGVVLSGTGFGDATAVSFNGAAAKFTVNSTTLITATVADGARTGPLSVTTPEGSAISAANFRVMPALTSFTPSSAPAGSTIILNGSGFDDASNVHFDGAAATFAVDSDTVITATVPSGAATGKITVTNLGGTATSSTSFTVLAPTTVTVGSFTPTSGLVGSTVVLSGSGFSGVSKVRFNGGAAKFVVLNQTLITTTVPFGASTGTLTVTTPGGTATSATNFTVIAVAPKLTLKLSGPSSGVLVLGNRVTATGKVTPSSLAGAKVTLIVQRKPVSTWLKGASLTRTVSASGTYNASYKPASIGSYRMKVTVAEAGTNSAASTTWRTFKVQ